jgi:hypothetical protein
VFHVLTVHWRRDVWIEPQLRYIARYLPPDTRVYASLNGIDRAYWDAFAFADELPGTHADKLNALAAVACKEASAGDHLLFMDGDAFPIAPIGPELLRDAPLTAVRRDENLGDPQPHPCFCLTTKRFWSDVGGDWRAGGYTWTNALGYRTTDVGARLLQQLRSRDIRWRPLLRSNRVNLHPLWFGVYGDVVYHQGAGFRGKVARATLDLRRARVPSWLPVARRIDKQLATRAALRRRRNGSAEIESNEALAAEILAEIRSGREFERRLIPLATDTNETR